MNASLTCMVTGEEVKVAATQMGSLKAPGPDGFSGIFYNEYWDIIAADVNSIIASMMEGAQNPVSINATHIVLIPKVLKPEVVSQFRPISLCNFSYKILSKILANCLKTVLPELISPSQNAFVAGRQIQDNIGITYEVFHFLKSRRTKCKFELGIKLDMNKAYDRVEWDFLLAVMEKMGFDCKWRNLILGCISSVNFSILLNGQPGSKFMPSRGLRQGDPLSPYLFLLVSEVLSLRLMQASNQGRINGIQMSPKGPTISHILFADDTIIFLRADEVNCQRVIDLINDYCLASGQLVNRSKSSVFFGSNVPEVLAIKLADILGMARVGDPGIYLGVPAIWGRSKKAGLSYIKGRLLGKLQGWKNSSLSQAGREVLIKAVAQAIPAYPMNLFKFPSTFCKELDALISNFWWGQKDGGNRIHWVSREKLGIAKEEGGLGFRNFAMFNDALLAKQCWRLIMEPNSLWAQVLKARYFPDCSFMDAKKGGRASWGWSSLLVGREVILQEAHWQIMNGENTRVWVDRWIPSLPLGFPTPLGPVQVSKNLKVKSLICPNSESWDIEFLKPFVVEHEWEAIKDVIIGDTALGDRIVWPGVKNGMYTVKSGYFWLCAKNRPCIPSFNASVASIPKNFWKCLWSLEVPPKIRCFLWKTMHGALATMAKLFSRRSSVTPLCPVCLRHEETLEHLFIGCPWVEALWFGGRLNLRLNVVNGIGWTRWLPELLFSLQGSKVECNDLRRYVAFSCWHIWLARCDLVFNKKKICPLQVLTSIDTSVHAFKEAGMTLVAHSSHPAAPTSPIPRWCPPCPGFVKINVDASWAAVGGDGFAGIVARDANGRFIAAVRHGLKASSVASAEAMAILFGCKLGVNCGWTSVVIESDSADSVKFLQDGANLGSWEAFPTLVNCCRLGKSFHQCRWSWVPRLANSAADHLASRKCREACDVVWVDRPPSSLVHVLCNDGLPCPPLGN